MVPEGGETSDIRSIIARRHDNGADHWATADGRIYVGNPYSTLSSLGMLHELGVGPEHEVVQGALALILNACRDDGRIRLGPKTPLYPCYTAEAARVLCRFGLGEHAAVERTASYLLDNVHETGGWRCSFAKFGRGPETECGSPGATLYGLDVLRFFTEYHRGVPAVDEAVGSLLDHWQTKHPIGPCHHGIGSLFMQVEYPFIRYNLFYYVYVLSFYERARGDDRFEEAFGALSSKVDGEGWMIVERPHRQLAGLDFCAKGQRSVLATARFSEIVDRRAA